MPMGSQQRRSVNATISKRLARFRSGLILGERSPSRPDALDVGSLWRVAHTALRVMMTLALSSTEATPIAHTRILSNLFSSRLEQEDNGSLGAWQT
ncbi:hypothetical protein RRG08_041437 [Elysia crispata]|uniref:Uncharacterized protein n=1 Tax=Elysia crispata TaxID=231223 RepID=A0AAE1CIY1_9GAST|nr:hypothetical protein RRG08_041437 [Elysia crispata]